MRVERYLPAITDHGVTVCAWDHCALELYDDRLPRLRLARARHGARWHWQVRHGGRWQSAATWPAVGAALMIEVYQGNARLPGQGVQLVLDLA